MTELIEQATTSGEPDAVERLYRTVAPALRQTAARYLRNERVDHTLQPTALVHDALLDLIGNRVGNWTDRGHFFASTARQMRRVLARHARERAAQKRLGGKIRVALLDADAPVEATFEQVLAINGLLDDLETVDARAAQVVELAFFAGMTQDEIAATLGVGVATVQRDWTFARAWLYAELIEDAP
ncbi:MAG: sigma-70 family RNA polymerase sigma factor [Acidobacteria bacterium]|nr:sigma-70 family RNA polymerase sigma factor [Acidobacteriota bacterium]